jgi:hypothetical protein
VKPRLGLLAPFPLAGLFAANAMGTVAIVAGTVLVVLAVLGFVLIIRKDIAPELELGKLKLRFKRLQGDSHQEIAPEEPAVGAEQGERLTPPWARGKSIRERVLSLPCARAR